MLPITQFLPQILEKLSHHKNLVLQAEPGAGKSTALPLNLMNAAWLANKKIIMLEPRRLAAKSIAVYLAKQLGEKVGERVGYQVKNDRKTSKNTILEIVTEGILTRRLQHDPELSDVGLVIFDEFHERSIHSDLALMLALEVQQTIREDLKLLVMSATIDTHLIATYLDNAPVIECSGRAYPVSVRYLEPSTSNSNRMHISASVMKALKIALSNDIEGDILVFLAGQADIKRCLSEAKRLLSEDSNLLVLALYGGLSIDMQEQALQVDAAGRRRIIFSTNIAETSLTIEGVSCVIDSGLEKTLLYDPQSGMTRLETTHISKASAEQRKGRAGRLKAGLCIRLWSEYKQTSLKAFQQEEILRADLSSVVLNLFAWGLTDYQSINWLTPPPLAHFESSKLLLSTLELVHEGVTPLGISASKLGLHPRLAKMLLNAKGIVEQNIACELAAVLAEGDLFFDRQNVDIVERIIALQDYKTDKQDALRAWPLKVATVEHALSTVRSLKNTLKLFTNSSVYSLVELQNYIPKLLLMAYPDRLAKRRTPQCGRYQLANAKGVVLFNDDALFGSDWLVVSDCNAQHKEGHIIRAAAISLDDIHEYLGHSLIEKDEYRLDDKKLNVIGRRLTQYQSIVLSAKPISNIPQEEFQACLISLLQSEGLKILNWSVKCERWLARASWLGELIENFPDVSEESLLKNIESWLLPYLPNVSNLSQLKQIDVFTLLKASLSWEHQELLEREAPVLYVTPSNKEIPIIYDKHQGPIVSVRLQEMFGEIESPKIGGKNIALRFELLSPAQRPIQTTSDLANFWQTSYFDVAKEMRGKYPRHRWPEEPMLEKPGHSIKHRRAK